MKTIKRFSIIFFIISFYACNDNFLELKPVDKLYDGNFWRTPADLELYCNSFYVADMFPFIFAWKPLPVIYDEMSDDLITSSDQSGQQTTAAGLRIVPGSGGYWSSSTWTDVNYKDTNEPDLDHWNYIRACNVFLKQYKTAKGDIALINHYVGVIRFFRAMDYFKKVSHFGDVPWIGEPLNINSEELVAQKRDPRALVMDSVLSDLNFAVANCLPPTNNNIQHGSVNVDVVNAYKSRICLFEGTFRKYRNLGGYEKFLQAAVEAAGAVMQTNRYQIWKGTGDPKRNYQELFWQKDIYATKECIMGHEYYPDRGSFHTISADALYGQSGFSMWFVRSYLKADGTPFPADVNQTFAEETTGRDPRLAQTMTTPGYITTIGAGAVWGDTITAPSVIGITNPKRKVCRHYECPTGYQLIKWWMKTLDQQTVGNGDNGFMMMRYAEVLLNFAEAKAELGTLSQADLNLSINLLRDRVGMPLMSIVPLHDPYSDWIVAGITDLPDQIVEIRRERRIELAAEGFRRNDLMRWKAGKLMTLPAIGAKYVPSEFKENNFPALRLKLDVNIFVDENMRFWPWKKTIPQRLFDENKDYLWPIPSDVIAKSNGGITQNPGW